MEREHGSCVWNIPRIPQSDQGTRERAPACPNRGQLGKDTKLQTPRASAAPHTHTRLAAAMQPSTASTIGQFWADLKRGPWQIYFGKPPTSCVKIGLQLRLAAEARFGHRCDGCIHPRRKKRLRNAERHDASNSSTRQATPRARPAHSGPMSPGACLPIIALRLVASWEEPSLRNPLCTWYLFGKPPRTLWAMRLSGFIQLADHAC